jgi:hypothetical protein
MSLLDGEVHGAVARRDPRTGQYRRGHKGEYHTRHQMVQERLLALQSQYKATNPADLALLGLAAIHLVDAEKARSRTQRVRACNAAMRILKQLPRKPEPQPTVDELLAGGVR